MNKFPRTMVGGVSLSRMIIGTNWFLGYSHTSQADDDYIKENICERNKIADILEVYFNAGIDTIMGQIQQEPLGDAIKEAEQRTGVKAIIVSTPALTISRNTPIDGFNLGEVEKILDLQAALGARFCMPHQSTTDSMIDRCSRELRKMEPVCKLIRERNMIPGLSTHMPEAIIYADETELDVETYISMYNSMGFLMQVEVDWVANVIRNAKKPVMTIKPLAAGQLRPFQGLNFVWNTIRDIDMVTIGTMSPKEAAECIELSLGILENRTSNIKLQATRSKSSIATK
jgi:hypothetical protein